MLCLGLCPLAHAQELDSILDALPTSVSNQEQAPVAAQVTEPLPRCSKLSDDFCLRLWRKPQTGNLDFADGSAIRAGYDTGLLLPQADIQAHRALLGSWPKLPPRIRASAAAIPARIRMLLTPVPGSSRNLKTLEARFAESEKIEHDFWKQVRRHAEAEGLTAAGGRSGMPAPGRMRDYMRAYNRVEGEVVRAQFGTHPNWLRARNMVERIRELLIAEVAQLRVPSDLKQRFRDRLAATRMVLHRDPDLEIDAACSATTVNAMYSRELNAITVCPGLFNSYQSEASLYFVLAHEFSHAVDPGQVAAEEFERSVLGRKFISIARANRAGATMSCHEWRRLREEISGETAKPAFIPTALTSVGDCLGRRASAHPTAAEIKALADRGTEQVWSMWTGGENFFERMTEPTRLENGKPVRNPSFLRPDRGGFTWGGLRSLDEKGIPVGQIYVQELKCQREADPEAGVTGAMARAQAATRAMVREYFVASGQFMAKEYSPQVVAAGEEQPKPATELYADALAMRIMPKYVAGRGTQAAMRSTVAEAGALFCPRPSSYAPDGVTPIFVNKQGPFDGILFDPHDDSRRRRISFFTDSMAELVGCVPPSAEEGRSSVSDCPL
jgi:hypothetical protein